MTSPLAHSTAREEAGVERWLLTPATVSGKQWTVAPLSRAPWVGGKPPVPGCRSRRELQTFILVGCCGGGKLLVPGCRSSRELQTFMLAGWRRHGGGKLPRSNRTDLIEVSEWVVRLRQSGCCCLEKLKGVHCDITVELVTLQMSPFKLLQDCQVGLVLEKVLVLRWYQ